MSRIIGLTGPTGSGKSSAALIAKGMNYKVIDCDKLARKAVKKGSDGLKALTVSFSTSILKADGTLNRRELARRAFKDKKSTELLNKTLLPHIELLVKENMNGKRNILLDAPTLFESGINKICDKTVAVLANDKIRLKRITVRDGLSKEDALLRMNAGKPDSYYLEKADCIVYNNGNMAKYQKEIKEIFSDFTEE